MILLVLLSLFSNADDTQDRFEACLKRERPACSKYAGVTVPKPPDKELTKEQSDAIRCRIKVIRKCIDEVNK